MTKPILLVGEAYGEAEAKLDVGFVGSSGVELLRQLDIAKVITLTAADKQRISEYYSTGNNKAIDRIWSNHQYHVRRTNVFNQYPPGGLEYFCGGKAEGIPGYSALLPSKYVRRSFSHELDRLGDEILELDPNLIVCLGNSALWALTGKTGVRKLRGTTTTSSHCVAGFKLLVTYHPSATLRQPDIRSTTIADLSKILREKDTPNVTRPPCEIWIEPEIEDISTFFRSHCPAGSLVAVDIETSGNRVTCIGFAPRKDLALVVPFDDERVAGRSYWPTPRLEQCCWGLIREFLEDASIKKIFQNGLYDIAFLLRSVGVRVFGAAHDTMLLHHALQPEALKGLGYLGSMYTDHGPWKSERKGTETIKRDD